MHTTFTHVHSHQDKTIPFHEIPLPVQLTMEADKLAVNRCLWNISEKNSSLYPTTKVHLLIDQDTITKNIP